jgi:hypothetical protein
MKTPRELILERHQSAEAKLKAIRAGDLAASARSAAAASGERWPTFSLAAVAQRFWAETLWPWRRVWAGVAAGWLVVLALNLAGSETSTTVSARPARFNPEVQAVLQQQEELLAQLLGLETSPHASRARIPGPRSAAESAPGSRWEASRLETTLQPDIYAEV